MNRETDNAHTFGLLRHGETVWNRELRVQGQGDSPLTDSGKKALEQWADYLRCGNWQEILCSDLGRVKQTVDILNRTLRLPVTVEVRLREQNWGKWEGLRLADVRKNEENTLMIQAARGWDFRPPQGESRREVRHRVFAALADCSQRTTNSRTLVVCHLGVIKTILYATAGRRFMEDEPKMIEKNCMHEIELHSGEYRITKVNITAS